MQNRMVYEFLSGGGFVFFGLCSDLFSSMTTFLFLSTDKSKSKTNS